jgi:hypothetical protein
MKDLIILVADRNIKFTFDGILQRHISLNIREIYYDIFIHNNRDPGVYNRAAEFLRPFINKYSHSLVILDKEGSGQEGKSTEKTRKEIKEGLECNGWDERAEVIVIEPELEIWAWTDSIHMAQAIGWPDYIQLKNFIVNKGFWPEHMNKPLHPKEAFELALREKKIPRSSSIYKKIADKVSLSRCEDRAFNQLLNILHKWFGN